MKKLEELIPRKWRKLLRDELQKDYFLELSEFVEVEYQNHSVYPPCNKIFRALELVDPECVKVVILGQDPYHGVGQACGLAFSVGEGVDFPPSLRNIFREVIDCGYDFMGNNFLEKGGNLERWARQGVLLLNAVLTVRAGEAASHSRHGWEQFTDALILALTSRHNKLVYMLWGAYAHKKGRVVDSKKNMVLKAAHPSPLSANRGGWFGCRHFVHANDYLTEVGKEKVEW